MTHEFAERLKQLEMKLSGCPDVTRFNSDDIPESQTLAHALLDLEEAFLMFLREQLPRLESAPSGSPDLGNCLLDIGENLRHILYHLRDPKFFQYLEPGQNDRRG